MMSSEELKAAVERMAEEGRTAWSRISVMEVGEGPVQTGAGVPLVVASSFPEKATLGGFVVDHLTVVLTEDGGPYIPEWHEGETGDEVVYFERWRGGARYSHGFLHPVSRKLVQAG